MVAVVWAATVEVMDRVGAVAQVEVVVAVVEAVVEAVEAVVDAGSRKQGATACTYAKR
jgi:hypothetical protein